MIAWRKVALKSYLFCVAYKPDIHKRRSIRLKGYDYSRAGAYFVTICSYQRECVFGNVVGNNVVLSSIGKIIHQEWHKSATIRSEMELDAFIIMPNHLHGIVFLKNLPSPDVGNPDVGAQGLVLLRRTPKSLSSFVAGFKASCTKRINSERDLSGTPVWQRNYYERIIRDEAALLAIRTYIRNNPLNWTYDQEHSDYA